jgi:pyridoxal phosphate enzyme (YggS family)
VANLNGVTGNLQQVRDRVAAAARRFGRDPEEVHIVAVAKRHPVSAIREAVAAGQHDIAESYYQEAADKIDALADLSPSLTWHFIGRLQANKTRGVAEHFAWVHSVDRLRIAQRLSAQRPAGLAPLQICLQVDLSGRDDRAGAAPESIAALAPAIAALPGLTLRGLMCLPPPETRFDRQRAHFRHLRELRDALVADGLPLDVLSAGMSGDLEAAIAEGATHVRVGTAVFGPRPTN